MFSVYKKNGDSQFIQNCAALVYLLLLLHWIDKLSWIRTLYSKYYDSGHIKSNLAYYFKMDHMEIGKQPKCFCSPLLSVSNRQMTAAGSDFVC